MKIKTFPLYFTEEDLAKVRNAAEAAGMTIKEFIHEAVKEKMKMGE